ncbi:MAG: hypothetical protein AB2L14_35970 [Candidatus Xenobiia bacterium LiM19]
MFEQNMRLEAEKELEQGERLLWLGRPNPIRAGLSTIGTFIFGIPWTAFALFWTYGAMGFNIKNLSKMGPMSLFPLFGIPFILIGIGMLLSPVLVYLENKRTLYIITDRRAAIIAIKITGSKTVQSYRADDIGSIERDEKADGSGDIFFVKDSDDGGKVRRPSRTVAFFGVPEVRQVEQAMVTALKERVHTSSGQGEEEIIEEEIIDD